jgi:hypothetical protein
VLHSLLKLLKNKKPFNVIERLFVLITDSQF